jgi:hypothetical protein
MDTLLGEVSTATAEEQGSRLQPERLILGHEVSSSPMAAVQINIRLLETLHQALGSLTDGPGPRVSGF